MNEKEIEKLTEENFENTLKILERERKYKKALKEIKEYIGKEDISKYVDCRSSDGEDKFKQPILDIINKAIGEKEDLI